MFTFSIIVAIFIYIRVGILFEYMLNKYVSREYISAGL